MTQCTLYSCGRYSICGTKTTEEYQSVVIKNEIKWFWSRAPIWVHILIYLIYEYDPYCQIAVFLVYSICIRCRNTSVWTLFFAVLYHLRCIVCRTVWRSETRFAKAYVFFFSFWFFHFITCPFSLATDRSAADLNYN